MDALLKALFSQMGVSLDPYSDVNPEKIINAQYGPMGADAGSPYGMWGALFGGLVPEYRQANPIKDFAPSTDPYLTALLK